MEQLINDFSPGLFAMQTLIMLVLIFILARFAWKPIMNSIEDREKGIQDALDAAENAKKEFQNLQADNDRILKEARVERDAMLKEAREMKEGMLEEARNEAKAEGEKLMTQAKEAIESEKKAAVAEIKEQVANLSVEIAEKVIREELSNKKKQLKLVDDMLGDIKLN